MRTIPHPSSCSRVRAAGAALIAAAVAVTVSVTVVAQSGAGPRVADGGCVAGDAGGTIHCSDVLNNSLNDISVHILGH